MKTVTLSRGGVFPSLVTSSSPSPGYSSWDTRAGPAGLRGPSFMCKWGPSISRTFPFDSLLAPYPPIHSLPSEGLGRLAPAGHSSWAACTAPAVRLGLFAARLASWAWLALAPPHSWFPCNEDIKMNRTGGRWWPRRTSNSPEQLKTETCTCTHILLQGGWNWSREEKTLEILCWYLTA